MYTSDERVSVINEAEISKNVVELKASLVIANFTANLIKTLVIFYARFIAGKSKRLNGYLLKRRRDLILTIR